MSDFYDAKCGNCRLWCDGYCWRRNPDKLFEFRMPDDVCDLWVSCELPWMN